MSMKSLCHNFLLLLGFVGSVSCLWIGSIQRPSKVARLLGNVDFASGWNLMDFQTNTHQAFMVGELQFRLGDLLVPVALQQMPILYRDLCTKQKVHKQQHYCVHWIFCEENKKKTKKPINVSFILFQLTYPVASHTHAHTHARTKQFYYFEVIL